MKSRYPVDGELEVLLSAAAEGAALYVANDGFIDGHSEEFPGTIRWAARIAGDTGESLSGTVDSGRLALPFAESVFERVILSFRKEWPADSLGRELATEIRRVLAPRGELLVIVRGRLGHRRVADVVRPLVCEGGIVERERQRWRAAVRLLSDWKSAPSRRALEGFLKGVGVAASEWFHPRRDSHGGVVEVEPLWSRRSPWLQYRVPLGWNLLRRSRWLVDEYAVRAGPAPLDESVVEQCLSSMAARLGPSDQPRIDRYLVTAKEKVVLLLQLGERRVVMRIPLSGTALAGCQRNLSALRVIADDPVRRGLAPLPLDDGTVYSGHYYTVESRFEGATAIRGVQEAQTLEQVEGLLHQLNPQSKLCHAHLDGERYDRLVEQPLKRALAVIPESDKSERLVRWFRRHLDGRQVTLGISHGDFSLNNIHIRYGHVHGLIDWDDSALEGLPIEDAISHLSSRLVRRSDGFASALLGLTNRNALTAAEEAFLQRCYVYFDIDPALHPALTLLFWIRVVDAQVDFAFARGASWRQSRIESVVNAVTADERFRTLVS